MMSAVATDAGPLIALALQHNALLLIDEEHGRQAARRQGLSVRGTLGILVHAYRDSVLTETQLRFYVTQIEADPDIWISRALCRRVLANVLNDPS